MSMINALYYNLNHKKKEQKPKPMLNEPFIHPQTLQTLREQLIPNYNNLDSQVQKSVHNALTKMVAHAKNKHELCQLSRRGELDQAPLLRIHLWKLLLGVLDGDYTTWDRTRKKNYQLYNALRSKFFNAYVDQDDLLDIGTKNFDQDLWDEIMLDTKRTHTNLNFFQSQFTQGKVYASKTTRHCDMLTRILYIWGKTNSTVRYVQGMNEILAPLYYLEFQSLETMHWDRQSEVFFIFSSLMSFVIDMHIKQMDDCESGIMGRMQMLNRYLRVVDGELWTKMEREGIYPQYYSFRWLALFLAQEFGLQETMRLWDFIFSYDGYSRFFFVDSVCVAILLARKKQIMENDFITSLPIIQKLKDLDVDELIKHGTKLFHRYKKTNISQKFAQLIANNSKEQELLKNQTSKIKQNSWSYAEIMKSTGNYLGKWKNWVQKESNK